MEMGGKPAKRETRCKGFRRQRPTATEAMSRAECDARGIVVHVRPAYVCAVHCRAHV